MKKFPYVEDKKLNDILNIINGYWWQVTYLESENLGEWTAEQIQASINVCEVIVRIEQSIKSYLENGEILINSVQFDEHGLIKIEDEFIKFEDIK